MKTRILITAFAVLFMIGSSANIVQAASDTVAPTVPVYPTYVPYKSSSDSITIKWDAATDNVAVAGYKVYRNGTQVFSGMPAGLMFNDKPLTANTQYAYQVAAYDAAGNVSAKSATVYGVTLRAGTTVPAAPSNLQATIITEGKGQYIALNWTPPPNTTEPVQYKLTRVYSNNERILPPEDSTSVAYVGDQTTYKDYPPVPLAGPYVKGTALHHYYVQTTNSAGNISEPSNNAIPAKDTSRLPIDISWPQCNGSTMINLGVNKRDFVIVGVNGGLATTTNPCLSSMLAWSASNPTQLPVNAVQPKTQLYVNTANPGGLSTTSWPSSNTDPAGNAAPNPHGLCDGNVPLPRDTLACAWQYGWNRAVEDAQTRFKPAAISAAVDANPAAYTWWLDVEIENTWKDNGTSFAYQSNVAVLEGMTAYFKSLNAKVGLYSTGFQWGQIVGSAVGSTSNLRGLPSWLAGAGSIDGARQNCSLPPLTVGGTVTTTQYLPAGSVLDYNYSCIVSQNTTVSRQTSPVAQ